MYTHEAPSKPTLSCLYFVFTTLERNEIEDPVWVSGNVRRKAERVHNLSCHIFTTIMAGELDEVVDASGWSASLYNKNASFVYSASSTKAVLELLAAKPGERIFDFGCGSGELTLQIAEMVGDDGLVVGVDLSETMASAVDH